MAFDSTYRASLRDIETCLRSMHGKLYHMGAAWVVRSIRRCERVARLGDLRGLRAGLDWHGTAVLCPRPDRCSTNCTLSRQAKQTSACRSVSAGKSAAVKAHAAICTCNIPTFIRTFGGKVHRHQHPTTSAKPEDGRLFFAWIGPTSISKFTLCSSFFVRYKKNILLRASRRQIHGSDRPYWLPSNRTKPITTRCQRVRWLRRPDEQGV